MKGWRLTAFLTFMFLLAAIIIGRLFYVQIIDHGMYQAEALGQQTGFQEVQGARGEIFSQNSEESHGAYGTGDIKSLAINKDKWLVAAIPKLIKDKNSFANSLGAILAQPANSILSDLATSDSYVIIEKNLSDDQVSAIKKANLPGASLENAPGRYYPQQSMAAQMIGFLGGDGNGQYGIEGYYNTILKGKDGIAEQKSGLNSIDSSDASDLNGSDLYLTLDYNIQYQAEQLLQQEKVKDDIDSGQIVVMDPTTGAILALANYPSFDLNNYSQETNLGIFQDAVVEKLFEPGSVFKAFTMAMALQEGKVTPDTTFVDTGSAVFGNNTVYNFDHEKYGKVSMSKILEKSINTGAVFLASLLPHQTFLNYLDKFGFNDKTGIDLQGEVVSQNTLLKHGSDFQFATAAFGQGIDMTSIQLVKAFSVFAHGGKMVSPYVVAKIVHGNDQQVTEPQVSPQIISPKTVSQVNEMLINVVEKGYGDGAKIPGYYLAGKTGTAQVPIPGQKGYYADNTIQSFIGYGPAYNPQFLILVKLDNPKVPLSALSAVPLFKQLAQYIINYWQIPPDYTGPTPPPH